MTTRVHGSLGLAAGDRPGWRPRWRPRWRPYWLAALTLAACSAPVRYDVVSPPRDWTTRPAVVELASASTLFAISDIHGGYDRLAHLLAKAGITGDAPTEPSAIRWIAGDAVLVVVGDLIDKGPQSLEVLSAMIALQKSAAGSGGRVIVTIGNHEAEFLADPRNDKASQADGIDRELSAAAIDPITLASGADPRGAWLRAQPFAAIVGDWFFAHAGDTHGRSASELEALLRASVAATDYRGEDLIGAESLLESRTWFDADATIGQRSALALGVSHIVFGHSPHALGAAGVIAVAEGGALFRIDCGMSPGVGYSDGCVLRVHPDGTDDVAESVTADGAVSLLWRGPRTAR